MHHMGSGACLDVRGPAMVIGLPLHPALKDLPGPWHIAQHFLHVDVFVPKLIHSGQNLHGPVPDVAGMVDEAVPHLHLRILQPHGRICVGDFQGPLPDRARAPEVLLALLPLCILRWPKCCLDNKPIVCVSGAAKVP